MGKIWVSEKCWNLAKQRRAGASHTQDHSHYHPFLEDGLGASYFTHIIPDRNSA